MKKIIIQEEVSITQKEIDEIIKHYEGLPDTYGIGLLGKMLDKKGIIKEIRNLTDIGKELLLMRYKFKKYEKSLPTKKSSNSSSKKDCSKYKVVSKFPNALSSDGY